MSDDSEIRSYRDLRVWNEAMEMAVECYKMTRAFPREEIFGLSAQIRRAASSIAANVAEGYGRDSPGSYVHHLKIAQDSLKEVETHLILAGRVDLLSAAMVSAALERTDTIGRMLRGLIRSVQSQEKQ